MKIIVAGAGVMGRGIAYLFGSSGQNVTLVRLESDADYVAENVVTRVGLPAEPPDMIVEAIFEDAAAKRTLFHEIEDAYGGRPVLATNTSGLPLEELSRDLRYPDRFAAMHFFHPAETFPLVEVVRTPETSDAAFASLVAAVTLAGREPIVVERPIPGYIINRLQHAILHEAYHLIESGIATPETIDLVAKRLLGPRFAITGLLEQKDLAGLRIHAEAQRSIVPTLAHDNTPSRVLQAMVERGDVGIGSGRGFYDWSTRDGPATALEAQRRIKRLLQFLANEEADQTDA